MPQFNVYERSPDGFSNGFDESYAAQIEPHANGEKLEDKFTVMADALAFILEYCWSRGGRCHHPRTAFHKFCAISITMRPDLVEMNLRQMASKLRISRAILSLHSVNFSDKAGLHFRPSRRQWARRKFSEVQKEVWRNGKRRQTKSVSARAPAIVAHKTAIFAASR
jgi:hypothetical protein